MASSGRSVKLPAGQLEPGNQRNGGSAFLEVMRYFLPGVLGVIDRDFAALV